MKKTVLFILSLSFAIGACTKNGADDNPAAIGFGAMSTKSVVNGKDDINKDGSSFVVSAYSCVGNTFTGTSDQVFSSEHQMVAYSSSSSSKWTYSPVSFWRPGRTYRFRAIWPYDEDMDFSDDLATSVTITDFDTPASQASQQDLLMSDIYEISTSTPVGAIGKVQLNFKHLLCNINLRINKKKDPTDLNNILEDEDPDQFQITRVDLFGIKGNGIYTAVPGDDWAGSWDVSAGSPLTCSHLFSSTEGNVPGDGSYLAADGEMGGLLLIPQSLADAKLTIAYKVVHNGSTKSKVLTLPLKTAAAEAWEIGTRYNYKLTLSENYDIKLALIDVEPWGSENIGGVIVIK